MSVIIRLQNLPWSANALDIRQYFRGLSIPEGGVHIVGGELGDAFIAFSTDEDARQAFQLNNGKIKEVQITLLLSSRSEMQRVIEAARTAQTPFMQTVTPVVTPSVVPQLPAIIPEEPKKDDLNKDLRNKDDSKNKRDRSRRRSRSRTRSRDRKDRSRDRRDRRRRDRSRSRDRRDRRRDRRGRSRSRERTRSRDRDVRRNKDDRKDNKPEIKNNAGNNADLRDGKKLNPAAWEQNPRSSVETNVLNQPSLLSNLPNASSFEDARRSLGLLSGLSNNVTGVNNRFPHNDMSSVGNAETWNKGRYPDNSALNSAGNQNQFPQNLPPRPLMSQTINLNTHAEIPKLFATQQRMPLIQDNGFNNRPFLSRPGTVFPDQFRSHDRNSQFVQNNDQSFRKDNRPLQMKPNNCVKIRPYFGGYSELRKFFQGLFINNTGIKLVCDNSGKRTGIAYVRFVHQEGKDQALTRTGLMLRGAPVEVSHLDDSEFEMYDEQVIADEVQESELTESPHAQPKHFTCVVVEDLPEFIKEHDIVKLFSDYTLLAVYVIAKNKYQKKAYVQFSKEEDASKAVSEKKSYVISGKPVTVRSVSDEVFAEIQRQQLKENEVASESKFPKKEPVPIESPKSSHLITDVTIMSGMPHKTTERDVIDFYSDVGIAPLRIHMLLGKFGPFGECYCEFNNPDDAVCAAKKNGMPLGTGTVCVKLFPRHEMERKLGILPLSPGLAQAPIRFPGRFGPRGHILGPRILPPNMLRRRPPLGIRYDGPVEPMGPPGCVVMMENVPFKAGVEEILEFFTNFEVSTHNVFRRFNDNGSPTGDARVTFSSPAEARRAVEECNKLKIRDRTVYLKQM